jgi:peptide-methionine (S)-S-oxide reductase
VIRRALLVGLTFVPWAPGLRPRDVHIAAPRSAVAVVAGGCYWGVESVFRHVRGVRTATSGYAVPLADGSLPPAEAVRIVYDPTQVPYRRILAVFFMVAHDPTEVDRQGPDVGPEYRSIVFVAGAEERRIAHAVVDSLAAARVFSRPIVTAIATLRSFQIVEPAQQNYAAKHPTDPYVLANDAPKLQALRLRFPALYH